MTVFAYTAPFNQLPEYINVSGQDNGSTIVTVRTQGSNETGRINLPPDELIALGEALIKRGKEVLNAAE